MAKDALGDRMKSYEQIETTRKALPGLPFCARLDGRGFSAWTDGLARPYDARLQDLMYRLTALLASEAGAAIGYTQSDEITLVWTPQPDTQLFFGGKFQKLASVLASTATAHFNRWVQEAIPEKAHLLATFDCRVWTVPSLAEAANVLLWRELDATKNSISMAARAYYSHNALLNKTGPEMQDMLHERGVNWNNYPEAFKRGTYVRRRSVTRAFTSDEIEALPPKHDAHTDPGLVYTRSVSERLQIPPLGRVTNRIDVLFNGAEFAETAADAARASAALHSGVSP